MIASLPDIPVIVYLIAFAPIGVIILVAAYQARQMRMTRNWPSAPGIIVTSELEERTIKVLDRNRETGFRFEERNFANIVYEYEVEGETYSNNLVAIGADRGNFKVAETVARYPVGRRVTVYYNPDRRSDAVLERERPGVWRIIGWTAVASAAFFFGAIIGFGQLTRFASRHIVNAPLAIGVATFATVMVLAALGMHRRAAHARRWPVVKGTISSAGLERFRDARDGVHRGAKVFKAGVSYRYTYRGHDYTGSVASSGAEVMTTSAQLAERASGRYRSGQIVDVHVNPDNPSESVLEPRARGVGVVWIAAIVLFALAAFFATKR
jgi:hypothetical protein